MKQLILEKEWIELLENRSAALLAKVITALCAYVLRGEDPVGLDPVEQLAYDFIKTEMHRNADRYDFDAAYEAAIKKKRAAARRAEKARAKAEAEAEQKTTAQTEQPSSAEPVPEPASAGETSASTDPEPAVTPMPESAAETVINTELPDVRRMPQPVHTVPRLPRKLAKMLRAQKAGKRCRK